MPEEAVLDIPVDIAEPAADPIETTVETPETPEVDAGTPDATQETDEDPRAAASRPIFDPETGKLDQKLKGFIDQMKQTDLPLARQLQHALLQGEALRKEIGTVKEARELKGIIEESGGREGIQELRGQVNNYNALEDSYQKASPDFIQEMVASNPDSFVSLAPGMMQKYRELDPNGFAAYACGIFSADLAQSRIWNHLELVEAFLPEGTNPRAVASLKAVKDYLAAVDKQAQAPVTTPKAKAPPDGREAELSRKETDLRNKEWDSQVSAQHRSMVQRQFADLTKGQKVTNDDLRDINELYMSNLKRSMDAKPNFMANAKRYRDAGDMQGYQRHMQSFYRENSPTALKLAVNRILKAAPSKPGTQANGNGTKPKTAIAKPNEGFKWRDQIPSKEERADSTTNDQLKAGWCYLKDGSKVQWKSLQKTA